MQVKICGLKDEITLNEALLAGADFIGLVFFAKSPRHVSLEVGKQLAKLARGRAHIVALVVDASDQEILDIIEAVQPDYLQLHGNEPPERVQEISQKFNLPLIKAIGVEKRSDLARADLYDFADIILLDAKADPKLTDLPGGNGLTFDWRLLKSQKEKRDFMLAGGLTPQNVKRAINLTGAAIVDVSSGVETRLGEKDIKLITAFIKACKN